VERALRSTLRELQNEIRESETADTETDVSDAGIIGFGNADAPGQ
jgi:hypothetical protein